MTARLWSVTGLTALLYGHPDGTGRFTVLVDGEREPVRVPMDEWTFAPCCSYCDQPAEVQEIDGQIDDLLCKRCARSHFDHVSEWVRPIPKRDVRELVRRQVERVRDTRTTAELVAGIWAKSERRERAAAAA